MTSIATIVQNALHSGFLPPQMETTISEACDNGQPLSSEAYLALDHLMGALLSGEVIVVPRKQFINLMEELVLNEAIERLQEVEATHAISLNLGDILAYALNRLPPLYATSKEGANFQRIHAQEQLQTLIAQQVQEAIDHSTHRPDFFPERQVIERQDSSDEQGVFEQLTTLLRTHAPELHQQVTRVQPVG